MTSVDVSEPAGEFSSAVPRQSGVARVPAGTYSVSRPTILPSDGELVFDQVRLVRTRDVAAIVIPQGTSGVRISGALEADGGAFAHPLIRGTGASDVSVQLDLTVRNTWPSFLLLPACRDVKVGGLLRSDDSSIVRAVNTSELEVSGVACVYRSVPGDSAVRVVASVGAEATHDVYVHDCLVDGGRVFNRAGALINIAPDVGAPYMEGVRVENLELRNAIHPADGLDVGRCRGVEVRNVVGHDVNCLVSLMSTDVRVSDVLAYDCDAQGVAVGDPSFQTAHEGNVVVERAWAVNCGRGYSSPASCGHGVLTTGAFAYRDVTFVDSGSVSLGAPWPLYGFSAYPGTRNLTLRHCTFSGTRSAVLDQSPPGSNPSAAGTAPGPAVDLLPVGPSPFVYADSDSRPQTVFLLAEPSKELSVVQRRGASQVPPLTLGRQFRLLPGDSLTASYRTSLPRMLRIVG